jgi:hypothetical protein
MGIAYFIVDAVLSRLNINGIELLVLHIELMAFYFFLNTIKN